MKRLDPTDKELIAALIEESVKRKQLWYELTFDRIAEKFGVSKRTVERIADEVRI